MSGASYNGYDWRQRMAILTAFKRGEAGESFTFAGKPCGLCGDPDRSPSEWHSEDYSQPFLFEPPATYPLCRSCHGRIHKRFNRPAEEWELFCRHVEAGGYGREFVQRYPARRRETMMASLATGEVVTLPRLRKGSLPSPWWRDLTMDAESLVAAWARPRPLRPRPDETAYREALEASKVSAEEKRLMRCHATSTNRSATMRTLAQGALGKDTPSAANLIYGRLAHRLCDLLEWVPDQRPDGSPVWMSVIAEGWQPPRTGGREREYEWVMVPALANLWAP